MSFRRKDKGSKERGLSAFSPVTQPLKRDSARLKKQDTKVKVFKPSRPIRRERTLVSVQDSDDDSTSSDFSTDASEDSEKLLLEEIEEIELLEDDIDDWFETEMTTRPSSPKAPEMHRRLNSQLQTNLLFSELRDRQRHMFPTSAPVYTQDAATGSIMSEVSDRKGTTTSLALASSKPKSSIGSVPLGGGGMQKKKKLKTKELPTELKAEMDQWLIAIDEDNDDYEFYTAEDALDKDWTTPGELVLENAAASGSGSGLPMPGGSSPVLGGVSQAAALSSAGGVVMSKQKTTVYTPDADTPLSTASTKHTHKVSGLIIVDLQSARQKSAMHSTTPTLGTAAFEATPRVLPMASLGGDLIGGPQVYQPAAYRPSYFTDSSKDKEEMKGHRSRASNYSFIPTLRKRKTTGTVNYSSVGFANDGQHNAQETRGRSVDFGLGDLESQKASHSKVASRGGGVRGDTPKIMSGLGTYSYNVAIIDDKNLHSAHEPVVFDMSEMDPFSRVYITMYRLYYNVMKNTVAGIMLHRMADRAAFVFDITTDITVMSQFAKTDNVFYAMVVFMTLLTPYIVCWSAGFRVVNEKKWNGLSQFMYLTPFLGIPILMLLDLMMILEAFILNPLFWMCGYYVREPSREEYGYLRLRAMAELFLENIPQVGLQFYIWAFSGGGERHGLTKQTVILSVFSAIMNICVMCYYVNLEADINHLSFMEYAILSMQGRFGFTPFVDRIANGLVRFVDYTVDETGALYFNSEALRKLVSALQNKKCRLRDLKMGASCDPIKGAEEQLLWQLYDVCARKYIRLSEERTSGYVRYQGETIMRMACTQGYDGVLRKVLHRQPSVDPDDTDEDGLTALMLACKFNHYTLSRQLMSTIDAKRCRRKMPNANLQDNEGRSAVMYACDQEIIDDDLVRLLLSQVDSDPNIQDRVGATCLMLAATRGGRYGTRAVKSILENSQGLDVNLADFSGMTPLMSACSRGHLAVVKMLCRFKDVSYDEIRGRKTVTYLIDIDRVDKLGRTAFAWACIQGHHCVVEYLLRLPGQRKVDFNKATARDDYYTTPLMFACKWEHTKVMALLLSDRLRTKLKVNATDKKGRSALMHCCRSERPESLRLLCLRDIRVDCQLRDVYGQTAFDMAAAYGRVLLHVFFEELIAIQESEKLTPLYMIEDLRFYCFMSKDEQSKYLDSRHLGLIWELLVQYNFNSEHIKILFDELGSLVVVYRRSQHVLPEEDYILLRVDPEMAKKRRTNVSYYNRKQLGMRGADERSGGLRDDGSSSEDGFTAKKRRKKKKKRRKAKKKKASAKRRKSRKRKDSSDSSEESSEQSSDSEESTTDDSSDQNSSDDDSFKARRKRKAKKKKKKKALASKKSKKRRKSSKKKKSSKKGGKKKRSRHESMSSEEYSSTEEESSSSGSSEEQPKRKSGKGGIVGFVTRNRALSATKKKRSSKATKEAARAAAMSVMSKHSTARVLGSPKGRPRSASAAKYRGKQQIKVTYADAGGSSRYAEYRSKEMTSAAAMDSGGVVGTDVVDLEPSSSDDSSE